MTGVRAASAATSGRSSATSDDRPIRVLLVDDSAVVRAVLSHIIASEPGFEVVGEAATADRALDLLPALLVDIVLLDVEMPGTDGLTALPEIMRQGRGARVLIVSSFCDDGAAMTVQALALGAADTLPKPGSTGMNNSFSTLLISKLQAIGRARRDADDAAPAPRDTRMDEAILRPMSTKPLQCLAIGASTGGLHALGRLFAVMPPRIGVPILVTQHLPAVFMPYFARQLATVSGRVTEVAAEGAAIAEDRILVAPGDAHLQLKPGSRGPRIALDHSGPMGGCLPSVDPMFASVADEYGPSAYGIVLTGMGRDGLVGSACMVKAGGSVLVQDPASSAVWGMPRSVAEAGYASAILDPEAIAQCIATRVAPSLSGAATWK